MYFIKTNTLLYTFSIKYSFMCCEVFVVIQLHVEKSIKTVVTLSQNNFVPNDFM